MSEVGMFRSVLVGDDGLEASRAAVDAGLQLAVCMSARLVLLGILERPSPTEEAEGWGLERLETSREQMRTQLEADAEAARTQGVNVVAVVAEGDVKQQMQQYIAEHAVDLVVLGHRELSRPRRWLEGSTSEELAQSLDVSMLVVRTGRA